MIPHVLLRIAINGMFTPLLLSLLQPTPRVTILLPKRDIVHKSSGLIMKYISEYKPASDVISITVSIPMIRDMCYIMPWKAMVKIPQCNITSQQEDKSLLGNTLNTTMESNQAQTRKNITSHTRKRRFITDIISIAVGTAATALSTLNTIQLGNIRKQMQSVETSIDAIRTVVQSQRSQLFHLAKGQIQLAAELHHTQVALNNTIILVNKHSDTLRHHQTSIQTLLSMILLLKKELTSFTHTVETHFIHESIDDILGNKLNFRFIHQYDMARVIRIITRETNLRINDIDDTFPAIELINRLLIQQRIHFIPLKTAEQKKNDAIGSLLFISFLASTNRNQRPFNTYELIPIPFQ